MRLVVTAVLITVIVALAGCAHVEGNYPEPKKRPPQLPETYEANGESQPVVWERPGEVRIFNLGWRNPENDVLQLRGAMAGGMREYEPVLKFLEPLADKDKVLYSVAVFLTKEATLQVPLGRMEISFADGTKVADQGAFVMELKKKQYRFRDSRNKTLKVQLKYASEPGKPVGLSFILDAEHMDKSVTRVGYSRDR